MATQIPRATVAVGTRQHSKPNLTRINFWLDVGLGSLMIGTGISAYLDTTVHIWFGIALVLGIAAHLVLHRRWIGATLQRIKQMPVVARNKAILGVLMLVAFVPLILSGIVVALIYAPNVSSFHTNAFYLFAGLLIVHLALSWRWIVSQIR